MESKIELNNKLNKLVNEHENLKIYLVDKLNVLNELENDINEKLIILGNYEDEYVEIIKKINIIETNDRKD